MGLTKSTVTIYKPSSTTPVEEKWFIDRQEAFSYQSELEGECCAEEARHIKSLSAGDVVRIETFPRNNKTLPQYFLCKTSGWDQFEGDTISLIRHLSW